ncbi:hypothetical protein LLG96_18920 [bacterium]|nr:hypothetical protein [bacterium]
MYNYMNYFYKNEFAQVLATYQWWKYFLPFKELTGSWTTTTLILTHFLTFILSTETIWFIYNALVIIASFFVSWWVFRSRVFSYTLAICMGFGTQLYLSYLVTGTMTLYLLLIYYMFLLFSGYKVLLSEKHRILWKFLFLLSLLITALAYEGWLDFLVFICIVSVFLFVIFAQSGQSWRIPRVIFIFVSSTITGILYVLIKTRYYQYGQAPGSEPDVVFNYPYLMLATEDVISNVFFYLYLSLTNFLPPFMLSSNSLYHFGAEKLIELQHGYHAPFTYLVPMHHLFIWRYYAGAFFVVFYYLLFKVIRKSFKTLSPHYIIITVFMLMIAVLSPTHIFIKFRPMNSVPYLSYKVLVGILGSALLISYLMMTARSRFRNTYNYIGFVVCCWGFILYSALIRPAFLSHLAIISGVSINPMPDPWKSLIHILSNLTNFF